MPRKLLFIVNVDWFFLSHRLPIALAAMKRGYEVHLAAAITDRIEELKHYGLTVHPLPIQRCGARLIPEMRSFLAMVRVLREVRPDIVHLVTIKPVLLGGIACRILRVTNVVAAISGLGYVFVARGAKALILRGIVSGLYKLALGGRCTKIVFQNSDDQILMSRFVGLSQNRACLIRGSGVDLSAFSFSSLPAGVPVVAMASRLLVDKGVREFVSAAKILRRRGLVVRFWLVGGTDPGNPASIHDVEIRTWKQQGDVECLGYRSDMAAVLAQTHLVVLPSYREGLPKVLLEAAACGRPIVTTDVPGCRDAIDPDITGLLVPPRDALALADTIERLLKNPEKLREMGRLGHDLAEREFAVEKIVDAHLTLYREVESVL